MASAPAQRRLLTGMNLGTVEIVKPAEHLQLLLEDCLISGDTATGFKCGRMQRD